MGGAGTAGGCIVEQVEVARPRVETLVVRGTIVESLGVGMKCHTSGVAVGSETGYGAAREGVEQLLRLGVGGSGLAGLDVASEAVYTEEGTHDLGVSDVCGAGGQVEFDLHSCIEGGK
jgi:hypothetical protein